jgi:RNA polymerase sigma factor (sigma-70 family)
MVAEIADVRTLVRGPVADREPQRSQFIAALYRRHRRSLLWYLARFLPNREDAEEVAQEAFVRLLGATQLEADAHRARNYLFATATNLARDTHRRRSARAERAHVALEDVELEANEPPPDSGIDAQRGCKIIASTLSSLQPRPRQAFLLYVQEELTYERIGLRLGVSKKTIERDIAFTLALCRSRLARWAKAP